MTSPATAAEIRRILSGTRLAQSVSAFASLGVADAIADGAKTVDAIAKAVEADPTALYRLLRTLAAAGLLEEDGERRFSLTELGTALRRDVPGSVREQAILFGHPDMLAAWANVEHAIRTGENAYAALFGEPVWERRARDPEQQAAFNRAMAVVTAPLGPVLAAAYDFGAVRTVADVGGGNGTLLAGVLAAHGHLRGIVFDQPAVVADAEPVLEAAGVADRAEAVGGSFFESVPAADVYLMKAILHDWPDAESIRILETIRAAGPASTLLVIDRVLGGPNEDLEGKLMDLHMLVMPGGLERTLAEWRRLFTAGGWTLEDVKPLLGGWQMIRGLPAASSVSTASAACAPG
ncbi:MAG TPA: methyltransferase [Candidatus Limnocylindrales bacterium]|nr:methyltransferase [Candidatus Limnocylindrales bacterium]